MLAGVAEQEEGGGGVLGERETERKRIGEREGERERGDNVVVGSPFPYTGWDCGTGRRVARSASRVIYCYWSNYATVECIFMRLIIIYDKAPPSWTAGDRPVGFLSVFPSVFLFLLCDTSRFRGKWRKDYVRHASLKHFSRDDRLRRILISWYLTPYLNSHVIASDRETRG